MRFSNVVSVSAARLFSWVSSEHPLRSLWVLIFQWVAAFATVVFVAQRVLGAQSMLHQLSLWWSAIETVQLIVLSTAAAALVALNWVLETAKWRMLLRSEMPLSWSTAFKGVLMGTAFGVFTTSRFGEFIGRILAVSGPKRLAAVFLSGVNGAVQTAAACTFGFIGFVWLLTGIGHLSVLQLVGLSMLMLLGFSTMLLCLYFLGPMLRLALRVIGIRQRPSWLRFSISGAVVMRVYSLALLRFLTFVAQYFVVFGAMVGWQQSAQIAVAASLSLFSNTVLAIIPIPDLLMREASALVYFNHYQFSTEIILLGVFVVWLINVALPAVVGGVVLATHRARQ